MSPCREQALAFDCRGETLVGVLATPEAGQVAHVALLIVVGGPQYRVGAHRQFVALARQAAAAGFAALRFDCRGMGDSTGHHPGFEDLDDDIAAAIDSLQQHQPSVRKVLLWGLCDGASAAALYLARRGDPRVAGLALLNPWVRHETTQARAKLTHWYGRRLLQPAFWHKLLRGGVGLHALQGLVQNARLGLSRTAAPADDFRALMLLGLQADRAREALQVHLAEHDATAQEFDTLLASAPAWRAWRDRSPGQVRRLAGADHTLTNPVSQASLAEDVLQQLRALAAT